MRLSTRTRRSLGDRPRVFVPSEHQTGRSTMIQTVIEKEHLSPSI